MIKIIDIVEKHNTLITIHGAEGGPTGDRGGGLRNRHEQTQLFQCRCNTPYGLVVMTGLIILYVNVILL